MSRGGSLVEVTHERGALNYVDLRGAVIPDLEIWWRY